MTVRLGPGVAFAQIGICGFDGTIELEALRLYGLPVGTRDFQAEVSWDLPSLASAATSLLDVIVTACRRPATRSGYFGYRRSCNRPDC